MEGRCTRRLRSCLLWIGLVALLATSLSACVRPAPSTSVTSLFATDMLYVEVMQHVATPYQNPLVFSRTIKDESILARVRQDIASVSIVSPDALFSCPIGVLQYYTYTLKFYQAARLVEVVTIDATRCEFIQVKDTGTGTTEDRCCPGADFWTRLQQAADAPLPA